MTTFLETEEDMKWLAEVHCRIAGAYSCAILHGNEDCPDKVELFAKNHYKCKPTVLIRDSKCNLIVEKFGAQKDSLS